jgi:hypothetical protein
MLRRYLAITGVLAVGLVAAVVPAFGKGKPPADPSISLNQSNPALGTYATFTTMYPSGTKNPRVQVECYQSGSLVYGDSGTPTYAFLLGAASSLWLANGGPANCEADLLNVYYQGGQQQVVPLASTTFNAAG